MADLMRSSSLRLHPETATCFAVRQFLVHEARLLDRREYEAWEQLWSNVGRYVVAGPSDADPIEMAVVDDDRAHIAARVRRLTSGNVFADAPPASLSRQLANVTVERGDENPSSLVAKSQFQLTACRYGRMTNWIGSLEHHLDASSFPSFSLDQKRVVLVNRDDPLPTFSYLL